MGSVSAALATEVIFAVGEESTRAPRHFSGRPEAFIVDFVRTPSLVESPVRTTCNCGVIFSGYKYRQDNAHQDCPIVPCEFLANPTEAEVVDMRIWMTRNGYLLPMGPV